jgi:two-component system, NarL family, sensor histidine kinase EvgS
MNQNKTDDTGIPVATARSIEELQKLILQKESVLRAKGRLIDNMAYQIRTLTNAIIGFSDLLLIEDLAADLMEYVKEINNAGNGLSSLVNEVLDWARLESGRIQMAKTRCNTSDIIDQIERMLTTVGAAKRLGFSVSADPDVPSAVLTDWDRLMKCLTNLVINAFKDTTEGKLECCVSQELVEGIRQVRFDVIDRCRFLKLEEIAQLSEPAAEEADAHSEILSMLNMGMTVTAGLPLTLQLAEALGGVIEIRSFPQEGTIYSLRLPAGCESEPMAVPPAVCSDNPAVETASSIPSEANSIVLLVEDQPSNRTVVSLMLESIGVQADTAEDGLQGVEAASQKDYGLILMDLKMPNMDGYEAARLIRQANPTVPLIALSAKVLSEAENKQISSLFNGFLSKPIDSRKLAMTVGQYMPEAVMAASPADSGSSNPAAAGRYGNH